MHLPVHLPVPHPCSSRESNERTGTWRRHSQVPPPPCHHYPPDRSRGSGHVVHTGEKASKTALVTLFTHSEQVPSPRHCWQGGWNQRVGMGSCDTQPSRAVGFLGGTVFCKLQSSGAGLVRGSSVSLLARLALAMPKYGQQKPFKTRTQPATMFPEVWVRAGGGTPL